MIKLAIEELTNLKRFNFDDGSGGDVSGCDIAFDYAGRRWLYRGAYDRYCLIELVEGVELITGTDEQTMKLSGVFGHGPPTARQLMAVGLTTTGDVARRPCDEDASRLSAGRDVLERIVRSRKQSDDRTGYQKGDTNLRS